jgi:hypothetical protein
MKLKTYVKREDGTYLDCSFNKDGNLYVIEKIVVQRGMQNQKANEVIIFGIPKNKIESYLRNTKSQIVLRTEIEGEIKNV